MPFCAVSVVLWSTWSLPILLPFSGRNSRGGSHTTGLRAAVTCSLSQETFRRHIGAPIKKGGIRFKGYQSRGKVVTSRLTALKADGDRAQCVDFSIKRYLPRVDDG